MFKKAISVCLALLMMLPCVMLAPSASAAPAPDNNAVTESAQVAHAENSFMRFLKAYADADKPQDTIEVFSGNGITFKTGDVKNYTINVAKEGLYAIELAYQCIAGRGDMPAFAIAINGEYQFSEAESIKIKRTWKDINVGKTNCYNDEIVPESEEVFRKETQLLSDIHGYYGGVYYFHLKAGANKISFEMINEELIVYSMKFTCEEELKSYKDVSKNYKFSEYKGDNIKLEAEDYKFKSDTTIYRFADTSSAAVTPYSVKVKKLNTTGGTAWAMPGAYIEWTINVPEDGLYKLAVKTKQNTNVGVSSCRDIYIDGEIPFAELKDYEFKYNVSYKNYCLGADAKDKEPFLFELKKGEHTIRMTVSLGEYADVLSFLQESSDELGDAYRKIIMITTADPDAYRDYSIDTNLPEVMDTFKNQYKQLDDLNKKLTEISGSSSTGTKVIQTLVTQLKEFSKNPYKITERLTNFKTNITSLTDWIQDAKQQPLQLDYFELVGADGKPSKANATFFQTIKHEVLSFLNTFTDEYLNFKEEEDSITVWASSGQVSMNAVQELVEDQFIEQTGIQVNVKYVTTSILMALVAGKGPDVALTVAEADLMNWAFRDAVVPLNDFKDFDKTMSMFRESAITPVTFDGKTYGIPRTQNWNMLYVRDDVLEELDISVPQDWDHVITVMSALKKKNLEFGIPQTLYNNFLYQYGGNLYNEKLTKTNLTSLEAISSFHFFSSLFTDYSVPLSFNAENRFRTGEMPIVIADYTMCNTLSLSAPEIQGKWSMELYPAYVDKSGNSNRLSVATTGYSAILCDEDDPEKLNKCWKFLQWWMSADVQYDYCMKMEQNLGVSGRVPSANIETFNRLGWNPNDLKKLNVQADSLVGIPAVPGNYYVSRHLSNALNKVLYYAGVPAEELTSFSLIIDAEIERKRDELGFNDDIKKGGK